MGMKRSMQPKYRRRRQWAGALAIALVVLLVGVTGYVWYEREVAGVRDYEGTGNGTVVMIRVEPGDSVDSLSRQLVDKKVVGSRRALMAEAEKMQPDLQAGYYPLQQEMSAKTALEYLTSDEHRRGVVDIPNGSTLDNVNVVGGESRPGIYTMISKQSCEEKDHCVSVDELKQAAATTPPADLGVPEWAQKQVAARGDDPKRIEGLISPGVHLFDPSSSPKDILKTLLTTSAKEYEDTGLISASKTVNLTPYEMLTAASLVEREAPANDFDKVARVILNRLAIGQKLEFDSTVNYSIDEVEVATTNADRKKETPWNTYAKEGLPATPIASSGLQALHAMEHPAEGDWLYFVTVDKDGRTVFNRDFAAHENAIQESINNGVLDSKR